MSPDLKRFWESDCEKNLNTRFFPESFHFKQPVNNELTINWP